MHSSVLLLSFYKYYLISLGSEIYLIDIETFVTIELSLESDWFVLENYPNED